MKKIGIIDYYIDEWHSNEYLGLFKKAAEELGLDYQITYGWAEMDRFADRMSTQEWCDAKGIIRCETIEEICEKSDNLLILAPADPQKHLGYAKKALAYGKSTYIDKTFAENVEVAKEIYNVAEKYGTKIFSTSALRFSEELDELKNAESLIVTGSGRSLEEYVIHQIEMAVKVMGSNVNEVQVFNRKYQSTVIIDFNGKPCTINFSYSGIPFAVDATLAGEEKSRYAPIKSNYFYNLAKAILTFFNTDTPPFDKDQTIAAIAIRDAIMQAKEKGYGKTAKVIK